MREWEERKSLLAQRRVESVRLLTVLLNRVKDFAQLASQKVDPSFGIRKDDSCSETASKDALQEPVNSCYHTHRELKREEEFKYLLTQKGDSICSEEGAVSNCHASTCAIVRTILNDLSTAPSSARWPGRDAHNSFGWESLLITVTQDCRVIESFHERDFPELSVVHTQTVSDEDCCKKQKVYETDEFIHYLLNYYHTPGYACVCLEPKTTASRSWWKRAVSDDDDGGFDISLSNHCAQPLRDVTPVLNLNKRNCTRDDDERLVITIGELESTDTVVERKVWGGSLAKKLPVQRNDSLPVDHLRHAGLNNSLNCTAVTLDKEFKQEDGSSEGTVPCRTCTSSHTLKEDVSESEYFREAQGDSMKRTETERRCEELYCSYDKGCLPAGAGERKLLAYLENGTLEGKKRESSKCSFCSMSVHKDLAMQSEHKKSCKRSSSKLRCEGQKSERQSREEERNAHKMKKKRKMLSPDLLSNECGFAEMDSCLQLESLRKIQRECKKMFHKKVKFKTLHRAVAAPDVSCHNGSLFQETLQRTGDERKSMLRREMDGDVRGCPLFPLEIIQTNPCPDNYCGAEPRRGC